MCRKWSHAEIARVDKRKKCSTTYISNNGQWENWWYKLQFWAPLLGVGLKTQKVLF